MVCMSHRSGLWSQPLDTQAIQPQALVIAVHAVRPKLVLLEAGVMCRPVNASMVAALIVVPTGQITMSPRGEAMVVPGLAKQVMVAAMDC